MLISNLITYFPEEIYKGLDAYLKNDLEEKSKTIEEIRLRADKPIILKFNKKETILKINVTQEDILKTLQKICENSIYSYQNQIKDGFITIKGGHRIGISGNCVIEDNKVTNIKYISSLNFRIAREVLNCSTRILREIIDIENKTIYNTIIVAPPGKGKTTVLRDVIRRLSNGLEEINFRGKICGVVDERGEIAAMYKGVPQNDVGIRTDIIENVSKNQGIHMLVRTMAPEIIACDEIGSKEDVEAIHYALYSGVKGIFTMHGKNVEDIKNNRQIYELIENREIQKVVFL